MDGRTGTGSIPPQPVSPSPAVFSVHFDDGGSTVVIACSRATAMSLLLGLHAGKGRGYPLNDLMMSLRAAFQEYE